MKFDELLRVVGTEPVFETGFLLAGAVDPRDVRRQLSRWVAAGRVVQLRRGLYALSATHRKTAPHPFLLSNRLAGPSYVSLQSALASGGLIPEYVPVTTGVTTGRPGLRSTPLGSFLFRHVHRRLFWGFREVGVGADQRALVAWPEKALLDLVYLEAPADLTAFLHGLRLQNLEGLDEGRLGDFCRRFARPWAETVLHEILHLARVGSEEYETL